MKKAMMSKELMGRSQLRQGVKDYHYTSNRKRELEMPCSQSMGALPAGVG